MKYFDRPGVDNDQEVIYSNQLLSNLEHVNQDVRESFFRPEICYVTNFEAYRAAEKLLPHEMGKKYVLC